MSEVERLAREIGANFAPGDDTPEFRRAFILILVATLGSYSFESRYRSEVQAWTDQIARTTPTFFPASLDAVRAEIEALDDGDGWATDTTGLALQQVCLSLMPGTRWMAESAASVWRLATGCGRENGIVLASRNAWIRHAYLQARLDAAPDDSSIPQPI